MVNGERLYQHIHELGEIGKDKNGGVTRFPYTKDDELAKQYIISKMKEANLSVSIDAVGNIIGTKQGITNNRILCGSHFDTVKNGGNFDGCLGVLGAIEVLQSMHEQNIDLKDTIDVIAFRDEEGNRFSTGMIGSRSICGTFYKDDLLAVDEDGITLKRAANTIGYPVEEYASCAYDFQNVKAYLELHIEQGSVLEKNNHSVGVVKGIAGLRRFMISIHGVSGHSGAIPMEDRIDPVIAFSKVSLFMAQCIKKYPEAVVTTGEIYVYPGACNIISDHLTFSLDVRSLSMDDINAFMNEVMHYLERLKEEGYFYDVKETQCLNPALCDENIQMIMKNHNLELNSSSFSIMSGAGHDAMNFYQKCPVGMIFVRSKNGFSHRPEEYSSMCDCQMGATLLFHTLVSISNTK